MKTVVIDKNVKLHWSACVAVTASLLVMLSPLGVYAQIDCKDGAGYECTYDLELEGRQIQKVPNAFKFQAKISQARLPVGDVTFPAIFVLLKRGEETVCEEELNNVMVRDSVLNMEIGRGMQNCNLDEIIANSNDIGIDVCIQNKDNCLKRIKLSTVPYAVKASFANTAQKAHSANEAVQCNYAHRVTADRDLFVTHSIGKGYYDFHTPDLTDLDLLDLELYAEDGQSYEDGGYIQWTPVDPAYPNLHITAKHVDSLTQQPIPLKELILHAEKTKMTGITIVYGDDTTGTYDMIVYGDVQVTGNERIEMNLEVAQDATVSGHGTIVGGATITNGAIISGTSTVIGLTVNNRAVINGLASAMDGLSVEDGATISGLTSARDGLQVEDGADIYGMMQAHDGLTVTGGSNLNNGTTLSGGATVNGQLQALDGLSVSDGATIAGGLNANTATITGNMTIGEATNTGNTLVVNHDVWFNGSVNGFPETIDTTVNAANELAPGPTCSIEGPQNACDIVNNADAIADNAALIGGKQNRVTGTCGTDQYVRQVNANGTVTCGNVRSISGDVAAQADLTVGGDVNANANLVVRGYTKFDCPSCGSKNGLDGTYNWGDLAIHGRVLSADNNLFLSPPGGYNVVIDDEHRAAGGETSSEGAGLDVQGNITAQAGLSVEGDVNTNANLVVRGYTKFDCPSCGSKNGLDGTYNWGDLAIHGRVLSADNNLFLSPPGGYNVIIDDEHRAAGGESTSEGSGLEVEGDITAHSDLVVDGGITAHSATTNSINGLSTVVFERWHIEQKSDNNFRIARIALGQISEPLTITENNNIGIGDTSPDAKLDVEGTIKYNALEQESDRRLKKDITDIPNALEVVSGMRGVSYRWKETERFDEDIHFGFIAQELQEVLPEIVGNDGEYLDVSYIEVIPYLVEAIKEQQQMIDDLTETCEPIDVNAEMVAGLMQRVRHQQETIEDMRDKMVRMQAQIDALVAAR